MSAKVNVTVSSVLSRPACYTDFQDHGVSRESDREGKGRKAAAYLSVLERTVALARSEPAVAAAVNLRKVLLELGELYSNAERVDEALQAVQEALDTTKGRDPEGLSRLAVILMRAGRVEEAESVWAQVKADSSDCVEAHAIASRAYRYITGDDATAMVWLTDGLLAALGNRDQEGLADELLHARAELLTEPDELQAACQAVLASLVPSGRDWPSWSDRCAALDTARVAEQDRGSPWSGVFRRLLIHSVAVGAMSRMVHLHADAMDDVGQRVIEAVSAYLPGGQDRLKTLPAWQLIEKNDSMFDAYLTYLDNVVKFAVAAQAAIDACAAGIVPANSTQLLPGEKYSKKRAHGIDKLPRIPDGIDRDSEQMWFLNDADIEVQRLRCGHQYAAEMERTGRAEQDKHIYDRILQMGEQWPDVLDDWANAVAYTLATALRTSLPR